MRARTRAVSKVAEMTRKAVILIANFHFRAKEAIVLVVRNAVVRDAVLVGKKVDLSLKALVLILKAADKSVKTAVVTIEGADLGVRDAVLTAQNVGPTVKAGPLVW